MAQMSVGELIAQLRTAAEDNTVINPYRDLMKVSVIALRSLANALAVATRDDPDAVTNDEPEEPGVALTRLSLPIDSDFSAASLDWALRVLGEQPRALLVGREDYAPAIALGHPFPVTVDNRLPCCAWCVQGDTREVYSGGG